MNSVVKEFSTTSSLLVNALIWYYIVSRMINMLLANFRATEAQILTAWVIHYIGVFGFGLVGSILSERITKRRLLQSWIIFGVIASCLPALMGPSSEFLLFVSFFMGGVFSFGMPSCLAFFAENTQMRNRGKKSGVVFLTTNLMAAFFVVAFQAINYELTYTALIAATWRGLGLVTFPWIRTEETEKVHKMHKIKKTSFSSILKNRAFMIYIITWLLFCLVDRFERPILISSFGASLYSYLLLFEPIIGSVSAVIGGVLADSIGRKRVAIYGFVALGLAYAVLGIMPNSLTSVYFYIVMDAIGGGILWVIFILVLWGDLASHYAKEKYYFIGSTPFFVTNIIRYVIPAVLTTEERVRLAYSTFSIASFFLFLAVVPLLYAPETLPKGVIQRRELRCYVEKAKRLREKYAGGGR